jgi:hypothetical protein
MKKLAWVVWAYALIYNLYGTWVLGGGLVRWFTELGRPRSLHELQSVALLAGPVITLMAMLWSLTWRSKSPTPVTNSN